MKKSFLLLLPSFLALLLLSCTSSSEEEGGVACQDSQDCITELGSDYICEKSICVKKDKTAKADNEPGTDSDPSDNPDSTSDDSNPTQKDDSTDNQKDDSDQGGSSENPHQVCDPGKTTPCQYDASPSTIGDPEDENDVRPCRNGIHTCNEKGKWGECVGQILPTPEDCPDGNGEQDGVDNNCDGIIDNVADPDGDGFTHCGKHIDCDENEKAVNPGAIEVPGDHVDNNCNGETDEPEPSCDVGLNQDSQDPDDFARAMDICQKTKKEDAQWGLVNATLTLADGLGEPNPLGYAILKGFGEVIKPKREHDNTTMVILSTGKYNKPEASGGSLGKSSKAPKEWLDNHQGCAVPSAKACTGKDPVVPDFDDQCTDLLLPVVNDPVSLNLEIKAPTNASSFSFNLYFFSVEYPNFICSSYNDFFVALLDSDYVAPEGNEHLNNPTDMNLAMDKEKNPVGVNLAPAGLFKQCENKKGVTWEVTSCESTAELAGTGFDTNGGSAGTNHGGTGWLKAQGNVVPGETFTLRLIIWDTGDSQYDSSILLDNFKWHAAPVKPGVNEE